MDEKRKFHHLPPLPSSGSQYLQTIDNILDSLIEHTLDDHLSLVKWLMQSYEVAETSAIAYIQCLARFQLVSLKRRGSVTIAASGRNYLAADPRQKCELIAGILLTRVEGCLEILHVFAQNEEALHLRLVIDRLARQFPYWRSRTPYEHRIFWLISRGLYLHDRYYRRLHAGYLLSGYNRQYLSDP